MLTLQSLKELEQWHRKKDPWGYASSDEDAKRKHLLLSEIPEGKYKRVLDIGCGQGFVTVDLPGERVVGVDISKNAIKHAEKYTNNSKRFRFVVSDLFELEEKIVGKFDLIVITGVIYPQYTGKANSLVYTIVDSLLEEGGVLVCVHIDEWYTARFPFLQINESYYKYREYIHKIETYVK